jgi:peptidoglycan pentaglycine glycine transferase (the first glycine)
LLGSMRSSTRTKIRQAQRRGVTVREGGEADLGTFLHLIEQTSRRQGFPLYPRRYYEQVWRSFAACDRTVLLFAEHGGQPLASSLLIACGDTVGYKMGGWSGERSNIRPNELLHWTGMQWARERGYRFYDFEGIDWSVARALMAGDRGPFHAPRQGVTNFKLGFGGDLRVFPGTYGYSYRPLLGGALRWAAPKLERSTLALTLVKRAVARDGWRGRLPSATG